MGASAKQNTVPAHRSVQDWAHPFIECGPIGFYTVSAHVFGSDVHSEHHHAAVWAAAGAISVAGGRDLCPLYNGDPSGDGAYRNLHGFDIDTGPHHRG